MKRLALMSALVFALSPIGVASAQNAAAIVSSVTSDATTRAVTEAVQGATQDAEVRRERRGDEVPRCEGAGQEGRRCREATHALISAFYLPFEGGGARGAAGP